jgi:nitroreductase
MMNETLKTINNLRTIHGNFSPQEINDSDLEIIIESATKAANASARQSYSIVITRDKEKMLKLCGYKGSVLLLFCVDFNRIIDTGLEMGYNFIVPDRIGFITGLTDTAICAQTAAIAAKSLGIDSLFTNGMHRGNVNRVYEILNLPEKYCFPLIALILGYPDKEPEFQKTRLQGKGIIHLEKYERLSKENVHEVIKEYDEKRIGINDNWQEEGYSHYLEWFYTKWSRNPDTKQLKELLETTGFVIK